MKGYKLSQALILENTLFLLNLANLLIFFLFLLRFSFLYFLHVLIKLLKPGFQRYLILVNSLFLAYYFLQSCTQRAILISFNFSHHASEWILIPRKLKYKVWCFSFLSRYSGYVEVWVLVCIFVNIPISGVCLCIEANIPIFNIDVQMHISGFLNEDYHSMKKLLFFQEKHYFSRLFSYFFFIFFVFACNRLGGISMYE